MAIRRIDRSEVVQMLREAAEAERLDFRSFYELGRSGRLDNPRLRDLWLIWGDAIEPGDVAVPA